MTQPDLVLGFGEQRFHLLSLPLRLRELRRVCQIRYPLSCRKESSEFLKNVASALGYCIAEDVAVVDTAIAAPICVGILWFIGMVVYDLILDPHVITAATLDSLSINPNKWIPR